LAISGRFLHTILGTALMASGTAALNQWAEREPDGKMRRTAGRAIPSGRVRPRWALTFGAAISLAGFLEMWFFVNHLAAVLGLLTLVTYLCLYTPLKSRTWWSTTIGAFPGAMPPLIGFAAARGRLTLEAWILGAILFLWQFPHFYAIAWMYREDYARAGSQMLPVVEPDGRSTAGQMLAYTAVLLPVSFAPTVMGMSGFLYLLGAMALGGWYLRSGIRVACQRTTARARSVLLASLWYLPGIYALMVLDRAW
jgi:protoheme IX farnesyltransferase